MAGKVTEDIMIADAKRGQGMLRWVIVGFVVAILLILAAAGWHFHEVIQDNARACTSAEAHCGEQHP